MERKEKEAIIRELAKQQAFGIKKLISLGGSYAVIVPAFWLKYHCVEIDGDYYFKLDVDGECLILKGITDEDVAGLKLTKKEG